MDLFESMVETARVFIVALPFLFVYVVWMYFFQGRGDIENILRVEFVGWRDVYTESTENTGFSLGTDGELRSYYGRVQRYDGKEAVFHVWYTNKDDRVIAVKPGTKKFETLASYVK